MGVHVDALTFCLLQKFFQVVQVVTADNDEGALFYSEAYFCGNGGAIGFAVGLVQQLHADEVDFAHLHAHGQQCIHGVFVSHGHQCLIEALGNTLVGIAQHCGVVGISGHSTESKENQGLEGADILVVCLPEGFQVVVRSSSAVATIGQAKGFLMNLFDKQLFCCWIKADVGYSGKKSFQHEPVSLLGNGLGLGQGNPRQVYQSSCNLVL